jgi:hypothetical protein
VRGWSIALISIAAIAFAPAPAHAERHVSFSAGGSLLLNGMHGGSRNRADGAIVYTPRGRLGVVVAARALTFDPVLDQGLVTAGVHYDAAASRPRLALALHGDVGAAWSQTGIAPAIGGGVETHLWIWPKKLGPLAIVSDVTAHLVLDGVDDTRLVIAGATRLAVAW